MPRAGSFRGLSDALVVGWDAKVQAVAAVSCCFLPAYLLMKL